MALYFSEPAIIQFISILKAKENLPVSQILALTMVPSRKTILFVE